MDLVVLLTQVIERVEAAAALLEAEWRLPSGPRGSGDKAEVDLEIESRLRNDLLALLNCDCTGLILVDTSIGDDHPQRGPRKT